MKDVKCLHDLDNLLNRGQGYSALQGLRVETLLSYIVSIATISTANKH